MLPRCRTADEPFVIPPLTCKSVMWKASWTSYKNSRASSMTVLLGVKPVPISWTLIGSRAL